MKDLLGFVTTSSKRMLAVVMTVSFLAGCQTTPVSFSGGVVPPSSQVELVESGERSGRYTTEDVRIDYKYSRTGNNLSISGTIYFADRILYNFLRVESFHADLIFLDAEGRVLQTQGLISSSFTKSDSGETFRRQVVVPATAAALSFGYSGTARSGGGGDRRRGRNGDEMYFSDYPAR